LTDDRLYCSRDNVSSTEVVPMSLSPRTGLDELCSFLDRRRQEAEGDLLRRYLGSGDEGAFAELLQRHGPMVLGLCRRVVGDHHAAEDVFQATFLTLARKGRSIRCPESLGAWLHGVAFRLAVRARRTRRNSRAREAQVPPRGVPNPFDELTARELLTIVDEELHALPENHRLPVILCCLEGLSREEAARRLGWSPGAVKGRLERGRECLRRRLEKRGLTLPGALAGLLAAGGAQAAVPAALAGSTLRAVLRGGEASPAALALMKGSLGTVSMARLKMAAAVVGMVGVLGVGLRMLPSAPAEQEPAAAPKAGAPSAATKVRDLHGDPLPEGAVLRLGTVQRRAVGAALAFRADGRSFVSVRGGRYVRVWDAASGRLQETRELPAGGEVGSGSWEEVALSPDGRWLVQDVMWRALYVWDLQTGEQVREIRTLRQTSSTGGQVRRAAFSPDSKRLAAVGYEGRNARVRVWDRATAKEVFAKDLSEVRGSASEFTFSPDGNRLLLTFRWHGGGPPGAGAPPADGTYCWDVASGRLLWHNKEFVPPSWAFSHDGKILSPQNQSPVIDLATGQPAEWAGLPRLGENDRLRTTPDGKILFVGRADGVLVWDLLKGREIRTLAGAGGDLLPSPDGKFVITNNGVLQRWDLATGKPVYPDSFAQGHVDEVTQLVFSADGRRLASGSRDGTVRMWDVASGEPLHVWRAHPPYRSWVIWSENERAGVKSLDLAPDGRRLLSTGAEQLKLWDTARGQEVRTILLPQPSRPGEHPVWVFHARLGPDAATASVLFGAHQFGLATPTSQVAQWGLGDGRLLRSHAIPAARPGSSALAPGGRLLVSRGELIDAESGDELHRLEGVAPEPAGMLALPRAFSADGLLVAGQVARLIGEGAELAIGPGGVHVWEAATGQVIARYKTRSWIAQVAFHPDPRYVAVNDLDGIHLWDQLKGEVVWSRRAPEEVRSGTTPGSYAGCFAFSPDDRRLATGHPDSTILMWDVPRPPHSPKPVAAGEVDALIRDLGGADAARAWQAVWRLADVPNEALPVLRARLKPSRPAPPETTRRLVADLDNDSFERREAAARRLRELGMGAEPALRAALQANPSAETRRRINALLASLDQGKRLVSAATAWEKRAVAVLERIGSAEARQILEGLADGIPAAPLTRQAKAALGRMR
jgi:RNA polymerase sigma factor (sigma-70 family)